MPLRGWADEPGAVYQVKLSLTLLPLSQRSLSQQYGWCDTVHEWPREDKSELRRRHDGRFFGLSSIAEFAELALRSANGSKS